MTLCQEYCEGDVLYGTGLSGDLVVVSSTECASTRYLVPCWQVSSVLLVIMSSVGSVNYRLEL